METHNPIIKRLDQLVNQWMGFEESTASTAIWRVKDDEVRMLETFFAREQTEEGKVASIFFQVDAPFDNPKQYNRALLAESTKACLEEENLKDLEAMGISKTFIESYQNQSHAGAWIDFFQAFGQNLTDFSGKVIAWLNPAQINDTKEWITWHLSLLEKGIPEPIRFMLIDIEAKAMYGKLEWFYEEKVKLLIPDLDMEGAINEMAADNGEQNPEDPGMHFRQAFVLLVQHSKPGKLAEAEKYAKQARQIAYTNQWPHLEVACLLALSNAYIVNEEVEKSYPVFEEAKEAAKRAESLPKELGGAETGKRLSVQCWMGQGSAHIIEQDFEQAMQAYKAAAPTAMEISDYTMTLEAWRMTGFCAERLKLRYDAEDYYQEALSTAEKMTVEDRMNSTLPYIGESLIRLHKKNGGKREEQFALEDKLDKLLGPRWLEKHKAQSKS